MANSKPCNMKKILFEYCVCLLFVKQPWARETAREKDRHFCAIKKGNAEKNLSKKKKVSRFSFAGFFSREVLPACAHRE